ncbi:hypothetical protein [Roseicella aquatilis]|uniref:FeoB-associated Cys-rich membrane protein n=1 Tax=Roseicella aquatilis TaxID=2527868 RepID=A0A4V2WKS5_9PROT|nr:hypothetical protein [Roseicella aquatilis]TCZ59690.1 hypothetical protein EXY23_15340 [Roseicella aquatilis]
MWQSVLALALVLAALAWLLWSMLLPRAVTDRLRRLAGRPFPAAPTGCGTCGGCGSRTAGKTCR